MCTHVSVCMHLPMYMHVEASAFFFLAILFAELATDHYFSYTSWIVRPGREYACLYITVLGLHICMCSCDGSYVIGPGSDSIRRCALVGVGVSLWVWA